MIISFSILRPKDFFLSCKFELYSTLTKNHRFFEHGSQVAKKYLLMCYVFCFIFADIFSDYRYILYFARAKEPDMTCVYIVCVYVCTVLYILYTSPPIAVR